MTIQSHNQKHQKESTSLNNKQNKVNLEENKNEEKIENPKDEKKPKNSLPPKPWLKKGPKKRLPEENKEEETQDEISAPSKGYNLNLLKELDDP